MHSFRSSVFRICCAAPLLVASTLCAAGADANPWTDVWRGTLGDQKITACFNGSEYGAYYGSYYYERHRKPIQLSKEKQDAAWKESQPSAPTGIWTLSRPAGATLSGQWNKPGQANTLPLRLSRVPVADKDVAACASDAYNDALEAMPHIAVGAPQSFDGKRYRIQGVAVPGADGDALTLLRMELLESGPGIAAVNRELLQALPRTRAQMQESLFSCRRQALGAFGEDGDFLGRLELKFWSARWLSVAEYSNANCGGAHPSASVAYLNWDLASGKRVNLWNWIRNSKKTGGDGGEHWFDHAAPDNLNAIIAGIARRQSAKGRPKDSDSCADLYADNHEYQLSLRKAGLVFSTEFPHASQACDEDVTLSLPQLKPFLSKEGAAAMQSMLNAR
ncbi:MAG: hypothetical protein V4724_31580 [Pseudomonadota bacterium]